MIRFLLLGLCLFGLPATAWSEVRVCPGNAWPRTAPEAYGYDASVLQRSIQTIRSLGATCGMIIVGGRVIGQWGDTALRINSHSVRKSPSSALYGLAIDEGQLDRVVLFRMDTGRSIPGFVWWYLFGDTLHDSDLVDFLQKVLSARKRCVAGIDGTGTGRQGERSPDERF